MARGEWQPINVRKALIAELRLAFARELDVVGLSLTDLVNRLLSSAVQEAKNSVSIDQILQSLPEFTKDQLNEVVLVALYEMYVHPALEEKQQAGVSSEGVNGQDVALDCWRKLVQGDSFTPQEIIKLAAFLEVDPRQLKQLIESLPETEKLDQDPTRQAKRRRTDG